MSKALQFRFPSMPKAAAPKREIIGEHSCEICGRRASFGYEVSYLHNRPGRWRCHSHRVETYGERGEAA